MPAGFGELLREIGTLRLLLQWPSMPKHVTPRCKKVRWGKACVLPLRHKGGHIMVQRGPTYIEAVERHARTEAT